MESLADVLSSTSRRASMAETVDDSMSRLWCRTTCMGWCNSPAWGPGDQQGVVALALGNAAWLLQARRCGTPGEASGLYVAAGQSAPRPRVPTLPSYSVHHVARFPPCLTSRVPNLGRRNKWHRLLSRSRVNVPDPGSDICLVVSRCAACSNPDNECKCISPLKILFCVSSDPRAVGPRDQRLPRRTRLPRRSSWQEWISRPAYHQQQQVSFPQRPTMFK